MGHPITTYCYVLVTPLTLHNYSVGNIQVCDQDSVFCALAKVDTGRDCLHVIRSDTNFSDQLVDT